MSCWLADPGFLNLHKPDQLSKSPIIWRSYTCAVMYIIVCIAHGPDNAMLVLTCSSNPISNIIHTGLDRSVIIIAVGITFALTFLMAFTVGLLVAFVIAYCNIHKKGRYSPSARDTQQPTHKQASAHIQHVGIKLKENISYGPVPSQPPTPLATCPHV